jgi:4-amino-4-deoxy-L-arabinose transferase-like glycosyltransferase
MARSLTSPSADTVGTRKPLLSREARRAVWVALGIFVTLALTAWARPLMLPDEGRYVGVAWEMMRSHDWLTPTLDGLPYFHKPPLFYWITAASMSVFGVNEWAARAAPLLGGTLAGLSLWLLARRHGGERSANAALLALMAQPLFFLGGQFANLDTLVAGCITATVALAANAVLSMMKGQPYRQALLAAYAMAALGVLAKGLIGFVIPGLVLFAWLSLQGHWRLLLRLFSLSGLLVFAAIAAPWFLAMQQRFPDFLYYFFVVQHFKRFAAGGFNNVQPFWFYPAILLLVSLPWWPWLRRLFTRSYLADAETRPLRLLMLCWFAMPVLFFSLPQSKLLGYVLPAVPALAWLVADGWRASGEAARRGWRAAAIGAGLLSLAIIAFLALRPPHSERDLGRALAAGRQAGEPVLMLDQYYFDLPFYARLSEPNAIVDDWHNPEILRKDTWRKEIFDAGRFAPDLAARLLLTPADLPLRLCTSRTVWIVGTDEAFQHMVAPAVPKAVASQRGVNLWRLDTQSLCLKPT